MPFTNGFTLLMPGALLSLGAWQARQRPPALRPRWRPQTLESAMRVSVVIPTANRPEQLARALHSVFAQTLPPIEVIVVIDGPDPCTAALLTTWPDARLRSIQTAIRAGAGAARNCGAARASGDWPRLPR